MTLTHTNDNKMLQQMADAIRFLSMDAVEQAKSGHPGAPMGMAEIALSLWNNHLKHNPSNPNWFDRDRFVLSNGHGSMLIYSLLHLTGYDLPMSALQGFRQLHSGTPGHPEVDVTPGVETTTGPLGQGLTNAVGMALAEKLLAAEFNLDKHNIVDHYTWVFVGDGCLMEGISHEACSLAGTMQLGKLIVFYDDNGISIDGEVKDWFTDNTPKRFAAYGWQVIQEVDGHNLKAVDQAIEQAKTNYQQPTLICCKTIIGKGAPNKQGGHGVHGAPLGAEEITASRQAAGWESKPFTLPESVKQAWDARDAGALSEQKWQTGFDLYAKEYPAQAKEFTRRMKGELPVDFTAKTLAAAQSIAADQTTIATRKASQNALNALAPFMPEMLGGSADLTGSNLTNFAGCVSYKPGKWGNHISWGVREFGMAAAINGIALHGGYLPYGGTFLTFSDYSRNAIRMAALMNKRVIHVFSHDSIGLGEDGPTHQSIEHIPSLRLMPNLDLWRPADGLETLASWYAGLQRNTGPTAIALSRQGVPSLHTDTNQWEDILKGGYILIDAANPAVIIIATGSETHLAVAAQQLLAKENIQVRVVSMPCTQSFDRQNDTYRNSVLPKALPKVAIEAARTDLWRKYVGLNGEIIGIDSFGESAPAGVLYKHFGITTDSLVQAVVKLSQNK